MPWAVGAWQASIPPSCCLSGWRDTTPCGFVLPRDRAQKLEAVFTFTPSFTQQTLSAYFGSRSIFQVDQRLATLGAESTKPPLELRCHVYICVLRLAQCLARGKHVIKILIEPRGIFARVVSGVGK